MEIIRHGRDPKAGAYFVTVCNRCKTKFRWHTGEAKTMPDPRDGDYYEVKCPVCGNACTQAITIGQWA